MVLFFLSYRPRTEFVLSYFAVFHNFARQMALIQSIQDDRSTTNYRIDHIIKRSHEENSIMQGLFSQKKCSYVISMGF